jgi:hypothetical protein
VSLEGALPPPAEVQATAARLGTGAFRSLYTPTTRSFMVAMAAVAAAVVVGLSTDDRLLAVGIGLAILLPGLLVTLWPYANRRFRLAAELFSDHNCHERAEWKEKTGARMPFGLKAAERWLAENPNARGRASLLLPLGRVAEADQLIAGFTPTTPDEAFDVELLRETRTLLIGGTPDTERLRAVLDTLPEPRERRHRRECMALLDAQAAVAAGKDPLAVLAAAREEIDAVYWRYRTGWALGIFLAGAVSLVTVAGVIAASIGFRGLG